ncbi:hypothetical protein [Tabrizicola sp.]|uniref:hypothetical protein n=1 Tax=Tabrizicola sp. TaxID=2005166 RepID=UPI002FDD54CC
MEVFIVGPDQIVAQDLADAIRANDPDARVRVFRRAEEVIARLATEPPTAVILHREPEGFPETALGRALATDGIPHGFLSTSGEMGGAAILASPFTEATVAALLEELTGTRQRGG